MRTKATSTKSLGQILRSVRKQRNLSQADAGKSVSIDQPTLSQVERGETNIRVDTLFRILAALDMEMIVRPRQKNFKHNEGDNG